MKVSDHDPSAFNGLSCTDSPIITIEKLTHVTPLQVLNNYMHVNSFYLCV